MTWIERPGAGSLAVATHHSQRLWGPTPPILEGHPSVF